VLSRGGYEYLEQKLMAEKKKKRLEEDGPHLENWPDDI